MNPYVMSKKDAEDLQRQMEAIRARDEGMWWFGRRILGGGFRIAGRTFFWGTHKSKPVNNKRVWVRP